MDFRIRLDSKHGYVALFRKNFPGDYGGWVHIEGESFLTDVGSFFKGLAFGPDSLNAAFQRIIFPPCEVS